MTNNTPITAGWFFFLFTLTGSCTGLIYTVFTGDGEPLIASLGFSGLAFVATYCLICWLGDAFMKAGFKGKDRSKRDQREMCVPPSIIWASPGSVGLGLTVLGT
jgi:UDP-N-acetylglucosamine--dolichyl-phosphate N-acetylglucosaminephosphotransferase